jgi:hypothetical protein
MEAITFFEALIRDIFFQRITQLTKQSQEDLLPIAVQEKIMPLRHSYVGGVYLNVCT